MIERILIGEVLDVLERAADRLHGDLRPVHIEPGVSKHAEGSVLIAVGDTRVLCTATVESRVPGFLKGTGRGWVTAEYGMLPRATRERNPRPGPGRVISRSLEIQRLIGRSLRAVVDLNALGERTITVDCDVLQADGGTRTASITGGFVAMGLALVALCDSGEMKVMPVTDYLAAVSVGIVDGVLAVDLDHAEDARADVDFNVVATGSGDLVEIQGTAEGRPFSRATAGDMLDAALNAIGVLVSCQRAILGDMFMGGEHP